MKIEVHRLVASGNRESERERESESESYVTYLSYSLRFKIGDLLARKFCSKIIVTLEFLGFFYLYFPILPFYFFNFP